MILFGTIHYKTLIFDKLKRKFFQATTVSVLMCGCTSWTLTKRQEKKLAGNYTRMMRAIVIISFRTNCISFIFFV